MSQEQYNHYMTLAAKYRQKGRNSIAEALERQAQAELDKPAMDINDIAMAEREKYNDPNEIAEPKKVTTTVETPTPTTAEQQSSWEPAPPQDSVPTPNYIPTVEEKMNQSDSEQFNIPQASALGSGISNGTDLGGGDTSAKNNIQVPGQQPSVSRQSPLGRFLQQNLYGDTQNYGNVQEQPKKNINGISQEQLDKLLELALNGGINTGD